MSRSILLEKDNYQIWKQEGLTPEVVEFLDSVAFGSSGAVYEHKKMTERLPYLQNPLLVSLHIEKELLGTVVFCNVETSAGEKSFNSYYVRYYAASPKVRGKGIIKPFSTSVMDLVRKDAPDKSVFFACVEKGNKVSYNIVSSVGYEVMGTFKTMGFSRYFPKPSNSIERITRADQKQEILRLLAEYYKGYSFRHFNNLFLDDAYYVIKENGEIVAGVQVHTALWVINKLPGKLEYLRRIVPYIPFVRRLFNPKHWEFLTFEGIYVEKGYENKLFELMEGLLAQYKLNSAMYWVSEKCPLHTTLSESGKLGLLHQFVNESDTYIMASFVNMDEEEIELYKQNPIYPSAFDYI